MASAARTARSASFSCACGYPNRAINPSPSLLCTWPPSLVTAAEASSRYDPTRLRQSSASSLAAIVVEPTRSQNRTVIGRRSASYFDEDAASTASLAASVEPSLAIALSRRLRSPRLTPSCTRSPSVQIGHNIGVDRVIAERGLVSTEAETPQPNRDIHCRTPTRLRRRSSRLAGMSSATLRAGGIGSRAVSC